MRKKSLDQYEIELQQLKALETTLESQLEEVIKTKIPTKDVEIFENKKLVKGKKLEIAKLTETLNRERLELERKGRVLKKERDSLDNEKKRLKDKLRYLPTQIKNKSKKIEEREKDFNPSERKNGRKS